VSVGMSSSAHTWNLKLGIFDICGVGNLHGYPFIVGGDLLSIVLVAVDPAADFLVYETIPQMIRQVGGVLTTP